MPKGREERERETIYITRTAIRPLASLLDEVYTTMQRWVEAFAARQTAHWDEAHGGVRFPVAGCRDCMGNEAVLAFHQEKLAEVEQEIQLQPCSASLACRN